MIALGLAKRRVGGRIGNRGPRGPKPRFSLLDAGLSGTALIGLVLNLASGGAGRIRPSLLLAAVALREGIEGLMGRAPA